MTLFLNILFTVVSVMYLAGRMYEIISITDLTTGFLTAPGVVTTPAMAAIIVVIAVCCGVIIFSADKKEIRKVKMPVGVLGIAAGVFFIAGGIVNSLNCFKYGGFIGYHIAEALGGISLIFLGIKNIKCKKRERIPAIGMLMLPVGVCLNSVVYEIKSIHNTDYLMRSVAGLLTLVFFMLLLKIVYAPGKTTRMMLYISALLNFLFTGVGSLAAVLGGVLTGTTVFGQLLYNVGFIFIGVYSLFTAFYITPAAIAFEEKAEEEDEEITEEYIPQPVRREKPVQKKPVEQNNEDVYNFSRTGNIDKATIDALFARKDEKEKQPEPVFSAPARREPDKKEVTSATIAVPEEKAVFRSSGSKKSPAGKKIVYKAPK